MDWSFSRRGLLQGVAVTAGVLAAQAVAPPGRSTGSARGPTAGSSAR